VKVLLLIIFAAVLPVLAACLWAVWKDPITPHVRRHDWLMGG
jgi:hypothetical protein